MTLLFLVLLESWPVAYGQALLDRLHSYDIERYEVAAEPSAEGLRVDCRLTLRVDRPGPLRFFFSSDVRELEVTRDGAPVEARLGAGGFETVVRLFAGEIADVPSLLTLEPRPPPPAGASVTLRLRYSWRPAGGWPYADEDGVQTHLGGFWLPAMADELFEAAVTVRTKRIVFKPAASKQLQIVPLVVGDLEVARLGRLEVYVPRGVEADPEALLDDLRRVTKQLAVWFGAGLPDPLQLVIEPRARYAPSYCAGPFVVVDRRFLTLPRERWLAHLAHEVSHVWWGHRVPTPVVGKGGTFLREGLAQWSGLKVAGALLGAESGRELFRREFRGYLRRADLRRTAAGLLYANEATLRDATYLDDASVPYRRGALVFRLLEHQLGEEKFRDALAAFARKHTHSFATLEDFAAAVGGRRWIDYYAKTTRLPDLVLRDVEAAPGRLQARIACGDPAWPGGKVPVLVETDRGEHLVFAEAGRIAWSGAGTPVRVVIDPERVFLDPVVSNNVWRR